MTPQTRLKNDGLTSKTFFVVAVTCCAVLLLPIVLANKCFAAADQEQFNVNSPVRPITFSLLNGNDQPQSIDNLEPYKSGHIDARSAASLITNLYNNYYAQSSAVPFDADRVTIIHILRWADSDHKTVKFQQWYVWDPKWTPTQKTANFYLMTEQKRFETDAIAGRRKYRLIYIHFNSDLSGPQQFESFKGETGSAPTLQNPGALKVDVNYKVVITKQQRQVVKDFFTVLSILGYSVQPAGANQVVGYFSVFNFDSSYNTSTVAIDANLTAKKDGVTSTTGSTNLTATSSTGQPTASKTAANDLASKTYTNEGPSWIGLSFAVPLTSYKDATYSSTSGGFQPKTINRQNIYVAADFYIPWRVLPQLTSFRYMPHPFFGVPIKGQPLRNTMLGLGAGFRWVEPFGAVVFNNQQVAAGGTTTKNHLNLKVVWGLKVSVDAVSKALTKGTSKTTQ